MNGFVIPAPPQPSIAVISTHERFPVRRIFCVGRNYAAHAREMGKDPDREPPFFFMKPADAVIDSGSIVPYPTQTQSLHFEIELVIAIGKGGTDIAPNDVKAHIWGACVGIDLTRRDLQKVAKDMGRPWDLAKGFDCSAPMAPLTSINELPSLSKGRIWLSVNDEIKQEADLADLIWPVDDHISFLSKSISLAAGDLIMTGTPAGVGAVKPGDVLTGGVDSLSGISVTIGDTR